MRKRHALFVAFHLPPEASSSGVLRTLKYIRYLDDLGWRVTVISPRVTAYGVTDPSLTSQLPASCRVIRTRFLNTKRHLSIFGRYLALLAVPDTWIGWLPWGAAAGLRVHRSDPFDLVYSTSPHATAHLIAARVAGRSGKPWVADFRDPWYEDIPETGAPSGPVFRGIDRRMEQGVISRASRVVTSTVSLRDTFRTRYPQEAGSKFMAILNGYDEADFAALPAAPPPGERLTFVHAGMINAEFRDPRPLFVAVRQCIDQGLIRANEVRILFLGGGPYAEAPEVRSCIAAMALAAAVEFAPR
ncbi:MAG: glycosyltransferase, partial [Casimicrobiaceae bacterium]